MQRQHSTTPVYDGSIFQVTRDEVEIKGKLYKRDIVHHNGGVAILVVRNRQILFVKQYRYAIGKDSYEIPAGKLEQGEIPYDSGMRELEEETGFRCHQLHLFASMYSTPGFCNEKIFLYWAEGLEIVDHPREMDEDEDIESLWISIDEALQMVEDGTIDDAKTMLSIQYSKLHEHDIFQ